MRRARYGGSAELREARLGIGVGTLSSSSSVGFAWRFLESSAAFLNSADWVTIVAVEEWDRSGERYEYCGL